MVDEIEIYLQRAAPPGHRRGGEPARGDIEGNAPPVIDPRRQREPDLADHLRPQMQGRAGIGPGGIIQ